MINHKIIHHDAHIYVLVSQCIETGTALKSVVFSWYTASRIFQLQCEHLASFEQMTETDRKSGYIFTH